MLLKPLYNPPFLIKKIFPSFQWESKTNKILLTFDDGPVPEVTPALLNLLNDKNIKAAFFCVGDNCRKYPEITREILSAGHTIGNHTFHHQRITSLSNEEINSEITSFSSLLKEEFNYDVKYFRPPHGRFNLKLKKLLIENKVQNVMWSLLTYDYKNDFDIIKSSIEKYLRPDSIIVLHDILKSKDVVLDAVEFIIETAGNKGFQIGTPQECLK